MSTERIRLSTTPRNVATPQGTKDLYLGTQGGLVLESPDGTKEEVPRVADLSTATIKIIASSTYTLSQSDTGKMLVFDAVCTVTAPVGSLTAGFNVGILPRGGDVTLSATGGHLNGVNGGEGVISSGYAATSVFLAGSELVAVGSIGTVS